MFGMGNNDDDERFWNLMMFKTYATDKEMEEAAPVIIAIIAILALLWGGSKLFT